MGERQPSNFFDSQFFKVESDLEGYLSASNNWWAVRIWTLLDGDEHAAVHPRDLQLTILQCHRCFSNASYKNPYERLKCNTQRVWVIYESHYKNSKGYSP